MKKNLKKAGAIACISIFSVISTLSTASFAEDNATVFPEALICPVCSEIVKLDSEYETQELEICDNCNSELYLTENPEDKDVVHIISPIVPDALTDLFNEKIDIQLEQADYEPFCLFDSTDLSDETVHLLCVGTTDEEETVWAYIDFDVTEDGEAELVEFSETQIELAEDIAEDGTEEISEEAVTEIITEEAVTEEITEETEMVETTEEAVETEETETAEEAAEDDAEENVESILDPAVISVHNKGAFVLDVWVTYNTDAEGGLLGPTHTVSTGQFLAGQTRSITLPSLSAMQELHIRVEIWPGVWNDYCPRSYEYPAVSHSYEVSGTTFSPHYKEIYN